MGIVFKKYIWILSLILSVVVSFFLAKLASLVIEGTFFSQSFIPAATTIGSDGSAEDTEKSVVDINVIIKRNFFDAKESVATVIEKDKTGTATDTDKTEQVEETPTGEAVLTSLDIKLWSTISVGDGKNPYSSCVVGGGSGKEAKTYTIKSKELFAPGVKIVRIMAKRVEFTNKGKLEYVELQKFAGKVDMTKEPKTKKTPKVVEKTEETTPVEEIQQEGDVIKIARSVVDSALADPTKLYTDIRAVPFVEEGKPGGFKLLSVKNGSLFHKLGVKRGDILQNVNGKTFDIQTGLQMMDLLKTESEFTIELQRRGENKTLKYQIQ